jgi:hypothetical protein
MTEGQQFFLIFCLLYLSECVLWVKPGGWVFLSGWWGRWKVSEPMTRAGRGRFVFSQPLPPLGWGFVCGEGAVLHAEVSAVRTRLEEFQAATARLRGLASSLVLPWFFALVPLTYWRVGATLPFWLVLGSGWALLVAAGMIFTRAHRRLFPGKGEERWAHSLLVSLVPQHAIRSPGLLARHWLAECHSLAVAAAVLEADDFRRLAARVWRELAFPPSGPDPALISAERVTLEGILREQGLDHQAFAAPPERVGNAVAYCPRCHVLFQVAPATCADCGGLAVVEFEERNRRDGTDGTDGADGIERTVGPAPPS